MLSAKGQQQRQKKKKEEEPSTWPHWVKARTKSAFLNGKGRAVRLDSFSMNNKKKKGKDENVCDFIGCFFFFLNFFFFFFLMVLFF